MAALQSAVATAKGEAQKADTVTAADSYECWLWFLQICGELTGFFARCVENHDHVANGHATTDGHGVCGRVDDDGGERGNVDHNGGAHIVERSTPAVATISSEEGAVVSFRVCDLARKSAQKCAIGRVTHDERDIRFSAHPHDGGNVRREDVEAAAR